MMSDPDESTGDQDQEQTRPPEQAPQSEDDDIASGYLGTDPSRR